MNCALSKSLPLKNFSSSSALVMAISTCRKGQQDVQRLKWYEYTYGLIHLFLMTKAVLRIILDGCAE